MSDINSVSGSSGISSLLNDLTQEAPSSSNTTSPSTSDLFSGGDGSLPLSFGSQSFSPLQFGSSSNTESDSSDISGSSSGSDIQNTLSQMMTLLSQLLQQMSSLLFSGQNGDGEGGTGGIDGSGGSGSGSDGSSGIDGSSDGGSGGSGSVDGSSDGGSDGSGSVDGSSDGGSDESGSVDGSSDGGSGGSGSVDGSSDGGSGGSGSVDGGTASATGDHQPQSSGAGKTDEGFPINLEGKSPSSASLGSGTGETEITGGKYPTTDSDASRVAKSYMNDSSNPLPQDMPHRDEINAAAKTYGIDPTLYGKLIMGESSDTPGLKSDPNDPAQTPGLAQANSEGGSFGSGNDVLNQALAGAKQLRGEINGAVQQGNSGGEALKQALGYYNTGDWNKAWADFDSGQGGHGGAKTYADYVLNQQFGDYGNGS